MNKIRTPPPCLDWSWRNNKYEAGQSSASGIDESKKVSVTAKISTLWQQIYENVWDQNVLVGYSKQIQDKQLPLSSVEHSLEWLRKLINITKYSWLYKSFITKYFFWNRIQETTNVFCHESLELYGIFKYLSKWYYKDVSKGFLRFLEIHQIFSLQKFLYRNLKLVKYSIILLVCWLIIISSLT